MGMTDPRVDSYIAKSADFARPIPGYFKAALKKNEKAMAIFEEFNYSNKKEYVEWVTEARTEETRKKRLATAVEWMSEGKIRNWKYVKK